MLWLLSQKALSLDGVSQYKEVLAAIEGNMKTDMDFSMMQKLPWIIVMLSKSGASANARRRIYARWYLLSTSQWR